MSDDPADLTLEKAKRAIGRFEAELRWMHGRRVVALKVGRRTYTELVEAIAARDAGDDRPQPALPWAGPLDGLPVYVCDATDHLEKVYADEDLKARLSDPPAALP
jgi:hypothetical protein